MILLDGKKIKKERLIDLKDKISKCDRLLTLAVIQVGNDEASNVYVAQKEKTALLLGCKFLHIKFDIDEKENTILNKIDELNNDKEVDGILVQMPLPKSLNSSIIQNRISYVKDVDGLTDINAGKLVHNKECMIPCTPLGILELLNYYNILIKGKHVVVVGRSNLVGKPVASLMLNNDATVTITHSHTTNLSDITKTADILIVAAGQKDLINSSMVKEDSVIIDVGINRCDGKLYGDVNFDDVSKIASAITPVPGGVGQVTVLELFENLYKAHMNNVKK